MSASSERVGPEIENGCPKLWTYMKAKLGKARSKGFLCGDLVTVLPAFHASSSKEVRRVSDQVKHGTMSFCHLVMSSA